VRSKSVLLALLMTESWKVTGARPRKSERQSNSSLRRQVAGLGQTA
jgi:hypothetical protein